MATDAQILAVNRELADATANEKRLQIFYGRPKRSRSGPARNGTTGPVCGHPPQPRSRNWLASHTRRRAR